MEELVATMPSRPLGATVDMSDFSPELQSYIVYSAAAKGLSRRDARISVSVGDGRSCQGTRWREADEIDGRSFSDEKLRHDVRGCRSEEDAVAVVSGGYELMGAIRQRAEEGKTIRRRRTEAGPGFELR